MRGLGRNIHMKFKIGTLMYSFENHFGIIISKVDLTICKKCPWYKMCSKNLIIFHFNTLKTYCCWADYWKEYSHET